MGAGHDGHATAYPKHDVARLAGTISNMYTTHFGLRELPFGITPDTSFFFACTNYQEALNTLLIATRNGEGFIKITGEVGVGKTLLCRKFMAALGDEFVTA